MDNSSFPRIFDFKNKLLPDLIPYFLTRPAINKPSLISSIHTIPVIAMNHQLPFKALTQKSFPMNIPFH